jgi:hypothetical protein
MADKSNSKIVEQMAIVIKPHAKQRMKGRVVTEKQIINVLQNIEVVTVLWVDERRLKTLGFTRI